MRRYRREKPRRHPLVTRDELFAKGAEVVQGQRCFLALLQHADRRDELAIALVGGADHGAHRDAGMLHHRVFDLCRVDILSALGMRRGERVYADQRQRGMSVMSRDKKR